PAASSTCSPAAPRQRWRTPTGPTHPRQPPNAGESHVISAHGRSLTMRLGLIGLGRIGAFHANTLVGIPAIDSLVVTDIDHSKVQSAVDRFGVEGVDSLRDLFSAGVDGVVIAASTDAHTELILACVETGPPRRDDTARAAARQALESGALGWINTIPSTTLDPEPPTPEYVAVSGGMFRDCGVHDFDIIRWVTGQEAVEVYATGSNRGAD